MNQPSPEDYLARRIRALSTPLEPRPTGAVPQVAPLPGIRAVLSDVYGTLVISASGDIGPAGDRDANSAFASALEAVGIEDTGNTGPARLEQAIRAFHAERKAAGVRFPEVEIRDIWRQVLETREDPTRLAVEYECRVNPVWPMPGLADLLDDLRERALVMGIVSNAQFYTPLMLAGFLGTALDDLGFDDACCAWSYRLMEAKPSTRIYEVALAGLEQAHGIAPAEVLYVGNDIRNDIWPASVTGCRTALFAGDARSLRLREDDPCCTDVSPDRIVTELRQISNDILAPLG